MTPERRAEIDAQIAWWRRQEKWRVEGFGIVQTDPMYLKMAERRQQQKDKNSIATKDEAANWEAIC